MLLVNGMEPNYIMDNKKNEVAGDEKNMIENYPWQNNSFSNFMIPRRF